MTTPFDLSAYCQRIGYTQIPKADLITVKGLMQHQLRSVPFENLDVLAGKPISLKPEDIVQKIVHNQRGGYCYEVNGLFSMALDSLGIAYTIVACRPMFYPVRRPRTHAALVVHIDHHHYLVDLGFGSYGIREPMDLSLLETPVAQNTDQFMLSKAEEGDYVLKAWVYNTWVNQYGFTLAPQEWLDFMPANWMNSTHPEAVFTQKPLIVRFTPEGRYVLFGDNFKQIIHGQSIEQTISSPSQLDDILREFFHLQRPKST